MLNLLKQNILFDSHCHLNDEQFDIDRAAVIKEAVAAGVEKIVDVSVDFASFEHAQSYYAQFSESLLPTLGIHPELTIPGSDLYDKNINEDSLGSITAKLEQLFSQNKTIQVVGECGLDYYWLEKSVKDKAEREKIKTLQQDLFKVQLDLAVKYRLPVTVHARNAHKEAIEILAEYADKVKIVMHSFTGTYIQASEILEMGMLIGINGIVTYPSAGELAAAVKKIIKEKKAESVKQLYTAGIVLETDAPYLSLQQKRGNRNEPSSIKLLSEILVA